MTRHILGLILALSILILPVSAEYTGDNPLAIYKHEKIHGDLIYTIGDSRYSNELSFGDTYVVNYSANDLYPFSKKKGSNRGEKNNIKFARLYLYWVWSHNGSQGAYPEMDVLLNRFAIAPEKEYTDRKGSEPFDYPSGTYAFDVTSILKGSRDNLYTVVVKNINKNNVFFLNGIGLLLVYENPDNPEIEYWIGEGCDILSAKDIILQNKEVTTSMSFKGAVDKSKIKSATLWTIVPSGDKGKNELQFNNKNWKNVYKGEPYNDLAIDKRDVTNYLTENNFIKIKDTGDYMTPSNAFLVLEYKSAESTPGFGIGYAILGFLLVALMWLGKKKA